MVESTIVPLGPNTTKENIPIPSELEQGSIHNSFNRACPFPGPSSVSKLLADFEKFNVHDENRRPRKSHTGTVDYHNNPAMYFEKSDEMANIRAELEATRLKLAGYESRPSEDPHASNSLEDNLQTPVVPNNTSFDFARKDALTWSDYDSLFPEVPPQPQSPPSDFPVNVPPLRLPSATASFQTTNLGTNVRSSMLYLPY